MGETDELVAIAEIAIALAGFSAVIGVLGTRSGRSDLRVDALRLQVMLECALGIVAFALIPLLLGRFGFEADMPWRIASAAFLCYAIPNEILAHVRTRHIKDMKLLRLNVNTLNWCLSITADLAMLGVLLGVWGTRANACYLLGLYLMLLMAGVLFVQFAASTFVPREP